MANNIGYSYCKPELHLKYSPNGWFNEVLGYLGIRYHPIETRILDTLRYIELHPANKAAFSYEFGSIIRDIGSTFGSILDRLVRNTATKPQAKYDIRDYREFLVREVKNIDLIAVQLRTYFSHNLVLPFDSIKEETTRLKWWDAYNNLKHSEIEYYQDGCLTNVIYGMASLAIAYTLMDPNRQAEGRLFQLVGYFSPIDLAKKFVFPSA